MSFYSIKDPFERDRLVQDYKDTLEKIRERHEASRSSNTIRDRTLQQTFKPIVQSQALSAQKIVNSLRKLDLLEVNVLG